MKSSELLSLLEEIAPLSLSDEFVRAEDGYDNSGIIVDCGGDISGVLFSLDLSFAALAEAKARGFNAIVTHHPAIYSKLSRINSNDPATGLIADCLKYGISVISMHLNFDAAPEGIDYHLMRALGGTAGNTYLRFNGGAYGRAFDIKLTPMSEYVKVISENLNSKRIIFYGDGNKTIRTVASFCGAGCDDGSMDFAKSERADVFVSSDIKHHQITALLSNGINVIIPTHYAAENYGFRKIYTKIIDGLNVPSAYFCDGALL